MINIQSVMDNCDVLPYSPSQQHKNYLASTYAFVSHDGKQIIGRIVPYVVHHWKQYNVSKECFDIDDTTKHVTVKGHLDTFEKRNAALAKLARSCLQIVEFKSIKHWRNELYSCYYPSTVPYFTVERSFAPYLGITMYGVHINGYVSPEKSSDGKLKLWIAQRSASKPTWPGYLDNTIAGGMAYPYGVYDTVVKESMEEASVTKKYIDSHAKSTGVLTYVYADKKISANQFVYKKEDAELFVYPECEFIYDIDLSETVPQINDNEVSHFVLMSVEDVMENVAKGKFKPNCAVVVTDFLIRHGVFTPENLSQYTEIVQRSHRKLEFPSMI